MSIHRSEWLDQARKVPVGQKRRVFHGAEHTAAMDVYNNEDSWSCYCHRCHDSGKVYKQVIQKVKEDTPIHRKFYNVKDTCSLRHLASTQRHKYDRLVMLLHHKGMSTALIEPYKPRYNLKDDRLCFVIDGVAVGRDCTGTSTAKWLMYHNDDPKGFVYLQGQKTGKTCEPVIMVEDLFSAIKVKHYTGFSTLWLQGTRISDECIRLFVERNTASDLQDGNRVLPQCGAAPLVGITCLDSDSAGYSGTSSIHSRFSLLGLPVSKVDIPVGLDPKDLNHKELVQHFKHLEDL